MVYGGPLPTSENRFTITGSYLAELTETMRQRQMLDLDGRSSGQTDNAASFADMIWSDDGPFGDEWMGLSDQQEEADFWSEVFEEELLTLR